MEDYIELGEESRDSLGKEVSYDDPEGDEENGNNMQVQKLLLINASGRHNINNARAWENTPRPSRFFHDPRRPFQHL